MKHLSLLLISLVLITSACSFQLVAGTSGGGKLTIPSKWKLVSFGKPGAETPVIEGSSITLEFNENGQAGGNGGCNSYGGKYEVQGTSLVFEEITSTLMACEDEQITEQEKQYFEILNSTARFLMTEDILTILTEDEQSRLNFTRQ